MSTIVKWYATRGVPPLIAAPDRLLRLPSRVPVDAENIVMTCDLTSSHRDPRVSLDSRPDEQWLRTYGRDVPLDVLTAVVDGEVAFATVTDAAVGRAAVTVAPDGTRWVGLAAVRVAEKARRSGHARTLCAALLAWGAQHGATRAYVQALVDNTAATTLFESMGFTVHHRSRYVRADAL
jgi:GNAT superfamily N-acetyltransferase